jgi:tetratricopeptide (TPR) repeat protein
MMRTSVTLAVLAVSAVAGLLGFTQPGHRVLSTLRSIVYYNRGAMYAANGDNVHAIADYNEAIRLDPEYIYAFYKRGAAYAVHGDSDRAIADYSEAIRLDPRNHCAYYGRGVAFKAKGDNGRAIEDFNNVIRLVPQSGFAYIGRGAAYAANGDNDRAIADYNWAIKVESNHTFGYYNGGAGYAGYKAKEDNEGIEGIWLSPKYAFALIGRSVAYAAKGDNDRAYADFNVATRLDPKLGSSFSGGDRDHILKDDPARGAPEFCP